MIRGHRWPSFAFHVKIGKNSRIFSLSDPIIPFNGMAIGQSGSNQVARFTLLPFTIVMRRTNVHFWNKPFIVHFES